jgi:hypothetical protein
MVKQSLYKPEKALTIPEGRGSQISRQTEKEGGKDSCKKKVHPCTGTEALYRPYSKSIALLFHEQRH